MKTPRYFSFMPALLLAFAANAADFESNGLTYNVVVKENLPGNYVEIVGRTMDLDGVDLTIPEQMEWNGDIYTVIGIGYENAGAFAGKTGLHSVSLPNSLEYIGAAAFYNNQTLSHVQFPDNLESVSELAFAFCDLQTLELPQSVKTLGKESFRNNRRIRKLNLPDGIEAIPAYCFFGLDSLTFVKFPGSLKEIGASAFESCELLRSVDFPGSLREIKETAFSGDVNLENISFSEGLLSIGDNAFPGGNGYALFDVSLPASIRQIGYGNFPNAFRAVVNAVTPPVVGDAGNDTYRSFKNNHVVLVPQEAVESYRQHEFWGTMNVVAQRDVCEIALDGTTSLEQLIDDKYGISCAEVVGLKLSGSMTESHFNEISSNFNAITVLDLSEADCPTIPQNAMSVANSTIGVQFPTLGLKKLILPDNMEKIGKSAFFNLRLTDLVSLSPWVSEVGDYACRVALSGKASMYYYLSVWDANIGNLNLNRNAHTLSLDKNPQKQLRLDSSRDNAGTFYVPYGTRDKYTALLPEKQYIDVVEIFDVTIDEEGRRFMVKPHIERFSIKRVLVAGIEVQCDDSDWYPLPSGRDSGNSHYGIGICFGFRDVEMTSDFDIVLNESGIESADNGSPVVEVARYNVMGDRLHKPVTGVNIVVYSDCSVKKEIVR